MNLVIRMLKDGSGRQCIHWLCPDPDGPVHTHQRIENTAMGPFLLGGKRGRIACNGEQDTVAPQLRNGETLLCCHSDDPRAATCPACLATPEYAAAIEELKGIVATAGAMGTG